MNSGKGQGLERVRKWCPVSRQPIAAVRSRRDRLWKASSNWLLLPGSVACWNPPQKKALCSFWGAARAHQIIQHRLLVTKSLVWFLLLDTQCSASALQVCLTDLRVIPFSPSQPELESSQSGHIFHQKAQTILCYLENAKPAKPQTKWIIPKHISRWIMMNESQNTYKEISIFKRNPWSPWKTGLGTGNYGKWD